jgi:predicted component of type VI protein secretion system
VNAGGHWVLHGAGADPDLAFHLSAGTENLLGRAGDADLVVDRPLVSRRHCRLIAHADGALEVEDLESTNGTFVNGRRVKRARLEAGDRLTVGRVDLWVTRAG